MSRTATLAALLLGFAAFPVSAAGMKSGKVEPTSPGPVCFGPDGTLYLGDPKAACVYAITLADEKQPAAKAEVRDLSAQLAGKLGVKGDDVAVVDLAVNPATNRVYLSVARGKGPDAIPVLFKLDGKGELAEVDLSNVPNAKRDLANPISGGKRQEAITGLKATQDTLYVAGLSNEEFASTFRTISLPFSDKASASASVGMFHGAHGRYETASPVRTFVPLDVDGKSEILAAYTCTPLVRIATGELKDGAKVKGTTVAELGNRNRPLDIVVYTKDSKRYALMANSARGVMKVELDGLAGAAPITERVKETAGLPYATVKELTGVEQLDKLGETLAVLVVRDKAGLSLRTVELP